MYILHDFFRSSASFRTRIALNLKGVEYTQKSYKLREGEQRSEEYLALNNQGLVPALQLEDGTTIPQSLAIIEYLDRKHP
ncbi:MAG: glutathione S-transferase N-terminal domain-containing protein, partial [Rhodospirillales bacterium]|nr:glutathione S-transferase N-terminal domain-containing protein [Rhodospirillales bacterium]